jgi:hypothetical protein
MRTEKLAGTGEFGLTRKREFRILSHPLTNAESLALGEFVSGEIL